MTSKSRINTLHLQHLLKQYVGTDLSVLGNIPEDAHVQQSILKYLPVVELAPSSPAATAFNQLADKVLEMVNQRNGTQPGLQSPERSGLKGTSDTEFRPFSFFMKGLTALHSEWLLLRRRHGTPLACQPSPTSPVGNLTNWKFLKMPPMSLLIV
jgi:hypothetical protein